MRKILGFIKGIIVSVWALIAILTTILLISYNDYSISVLGKYSVILIDDDECKPFNEGDAVIVKKVSESNYRAGDKAFFYLPNAQDGVFVNIGDIQKVVEADHAEDSYYFDKDAVVGYNDMIGKADGAIVYHHLGTILSIFESRWGFMFLVILPTIFAIVYEIYSIIEEAKNDEED